MKLSNLAYQYIETYSEVHRKQLTVRQGVVYALEPLGEVALINQEARAWKQEYPYSFSEE